MVKYRISIARSMVLIAIVALGICGLKEGTKFWASALFTLALAMLIGAVLSAVYSRGARRAGWVGFLLFGWVYFVWIYAPWSERSTKPPQLLLSFAVEGLHERIHRLPEYIPNPRYKGNPNFFSGNLSFGEPPEILKPGIAFWEGDRESYNHVGHSLGVLLFGLVGAAWARLAFRQRDGSATEGSNSIGDSVSPPLAR